MKRMVADARPAGFELEAHVLRSNGRAKVPVGGVFETERGEADVETGDASRRDFVDADGEPVGVCPGRRELPIEKAKRASSVVVARFVAVSRARTAELVGVLVAFDDSRRAARGASEVERDDRREDSDQEREPSGRKRWSVSISESHRVCSQVVDRSNVIRIVLSIQFLRIVERVQRMESQSQGLA